MYIYGSHLNPNPFFKEGGKIYNPRELELNKLASLTIGFGSIKKKEVS